MSILRFVFSIRQTDPLPHHTFEIDAEPEDKGDEVTIACTLHRQTHRYSYYNYCADKTFQFNLFVHRAF